MIGLDDWLDLQAVGGLARLSSANLINWGVAVVSFLITTEGKCETSSAGRNQQSKASRVDLSKKEWGKLNHWNSILLASIQHRQVFMAKLVISILHRYAGPYFIFFIIVFYIFGAEVAGCCCLCSLSQIKVNRLYLLFKLIFQNFNLFKTLCLPGRAHGWRRMHKAFKLAAWLWQQPNLNCVFSVHKDQTVLSTRDKFTLWVLVLHIKQDRELNWLAEREHFTKSWVS